VLVQKRHHDVLKMAHGIQAGLRKAQQKKFEFYIKPVNAVNIPN
jgi:hypothetical protein